MAAPVSRGRRLDTSGDAAEPPKSNPKYKGLTPPPSIDDLVARARSEVPGLSLVRVRVPTGPEQV